MLLLINLLLYYFTEDRLFYWLAVVMFIADLAIIAFAIGMYLPLISSIIWGDLYVICNYDFINSNYYTISILNNMYSRRQWWLWVKKWCMKLIMKQ